VFVQGVDQWAGVNNRLKVFWGLEDGNMVGSRRFCAHVLTVLIVHLAFGTLMAKVQRKEGSYGTLKLSPITRKLRERIDDEHSL
jgi:hypothetical protein